MNGWIPMRCRLARVGPTLNTWVDWFIPEEMKQSRDMVQAVRMFLFSHLFGPFLGHTISISMLYLQGWQADASWWILFAALSAFWPLALVLRLTGWYLPLSLISIQNLMFCIFWGCYQYGGTSSPILPWLVTVPLLAFFYLPERSTRILVTAQIAVNLALFFGFYSTFGFREGMENHSLVLLGLVSTVCASLYVSGMALYYASIVYSQGELEEEVHQHLETERKLREATGQAQRALMAKSQFLAKMSHELRNPLNAIIGYSEILIEDLGEQDTQETRDLTSIRCAGHRLLGLINELLELARLEAGKVDLRLQELRLGEILEKLSAQFAPAVQANGNQLIVRPAPAALVGDPDLVHRVAEGLLSNAVKFTRNGRITVSVSVQADSWTLSVADTGEGIPQTRLATLFDTFGRDEDETASKYGDEVRLGLPLSHRYCRLMGGRLSVESKVGVGTTATMTLPRTVSRPTETAAPEMVLRPATA